MKALDTVITFPHALKASVKKVWTIFCRISTGTNELKYTKQISI